ncbi:MAG: hypothetical protein ABIK85_01005, partial [Candidatus Eisenbacteria bacterium]
MSELIVGNGEGRLTYFVLQRTNSGQGSRYVERHSWQFDGNSAVSGVDNYYSRYYPEAIELRCPSDSAAVNGFARQIVAADAQLLDEIAFCVAHTPTEVLRAMHRRGQVDLFERNARCIYSAAESASYARLVDLDGQTRLELRTERPVGLSQAGDEAGSGRPGLPASADSIWVPVGRSDYYRFVVHPRTLFEVPARVDVGFWRRTAEEHGMSGDEWLRFDPGPLYGTSDEHVFWREALPKD